MPTRTFDLVGLITASAEALSAGDDLTAQRGCERVLQHEPDQPNALHLLGLIAHRRGDYERAVRLLQRSLEYRRDPDAAWQHNLAASLLAARRPQDAIAAWRRALQINPRYPAAYAPLARALADAAEPLAALDVLLQRLKIEPDHPQAHHDLAELARRLGRHDLLRKHLAECLRLQPDHRDALLLKTFNGIEEGRFDPARRALDQLEAAHGSHAGSQLARAQLLHRTGDNAAADQILQSLLRREAVEAPLAIVFAEVAPNVGQVDRAVLLCRQVLAGRRLDDYDQAGCRFALARLLDRQRRYDEAFDQFDQANRLMGRRFDRAAFTAQLQQAFDDTTGRDSGVGDRRPVLIVGMPRSGTTLVERMLAMHREVAGGGEMNHLAQLCRRLNEAPLDQLARAYLQKLDAIRPAATRVTDKNPMNWMHLGPISRLLPGARVIWCRRDPMATGFSCFTQHFSGHYPWAYDLSDIAFVQREHDRLMPRWRDALAIPVLELHYEDLVADPRKLGRALYAFCELDWTDDALNFHEHAAPVATASYEQVRKPIYTDANEKSKRYEHRLGPLRG